MFDQLREVIRTATSGGDFLTFGGTESQWHPVSEFRSLPNEPALYSIGLKLGVQYPQAISRIVYFGSTEHLRNRMRSYAQGGHNNRLDLLHHRFRGELTCSYHILPGINLEWKRAIEDAAMQAAFRFLGCYPICNYSPIDSPHRDVCRELIRILPCEELPYPQPMNSLNCGNGTLDTYVSKASHDKSDKSRSGRKWTLSISIEKLAEVESDTDNEELQESQKEYFDDSPCIYYDHVATWHLEKLIRINAICNRLKQSKVKGKSKVLTFDAWSEKTPRPDTWGEVALLKAREIAGTFYPEKEVWVKVRFEKRLLGEAKLKFDFYRGEDKSNLPQTRSRKTIETDNLWKTEISNIQPELPDDFPNFSFAPSEPTKVSLENEPCLLDEHRDLLNSARSFDEKQALEEYEHKRSDALDFDRRLKGRKLLNERFERLYLLALSSRQD